MWKFLVALAIAGAVVLVLARLRSTADRARFLRRAGLVLMAMFTVVGAVWIAAEAFADPGGWRAAGLVAMWLVPLVVLLAISWYRVTWATVLLGALTAGVVGLSVWFAVDPEAWRAFESNNGPVRAISSFVLAAPIALLGWRRPLPAGVLLVVLGVVPVALSAAGTFSGLGSLAVVSLPPVLTGILYLLAETVARRVSAPGVVPTAAARR
jgi:hypothetical protein